MELKNQSLQRHHSQEPVFPPDKEYKANLNTWEPSILLQRVSFQFIYKVFTDLKSNLALTTSLYSGRRIDDQDFKRLCEHTTAENWARHFVTDFLKRRNIELYLWLICDPQTSGVEQYSNQVRDILTSVEVSFPNLKATSSRTQTGELLHQQVNLNSSVNSHSSNREERRTPYTISRISTANGSIASQEEEQLLAKSQQNQNRNLNQNHDTSKTKRYKLIFIKMSTVVVSLLLALLLISVTIVHFQFPDDDNQNISTTTETEFISPKVLAGITTERSTDLKIANLSDLPSSTTQIWTDSTTSKPQTVTSTQLTTQKLTRALVTAEAKENPPRSNFLTIIGVRNPRDYQLNLGNICDLDVHKFVKIFDLSSYTYNNFSFDCASRIENLALINSDIFIDELSYVLNYTGNVKNLQIEGPDICSRNLYEGARLSTTVKSISLRKLNHLEFKNLLLVDPNNLIADCTNLFALFASYNLIKNYSLTSLSFINVTFTRRNAREVTRLIGRGIASKYFGKLIILSSRIDTVMFNQSVMVKRNFSEILIDVANPTSEFAKSSLLNLWNNFLNFSLCNVFKTNIPLTRQQFRNSTKVINRLGISTLYIPIYIEDCDPFSFDFLPEIQNIKLLRIKIILSPKCQDQSKETPFLLRNFDFLNNTSNFDKLQVESNANIRAVGVTNLYCRDFKRLSTKLKINRRAVC